MLRFKLIDENDEFTEEENTPYVLDLNFKDDEDFQDWADANPSFDTFMEKMETSNAPWSGVHDGTGGTDDDGVDYIGFSSYEIEDFPKAISMWEDFFRKHGKLIENNGKKLVKESLNESVADKKVRAFFQKHHAQIYRAWKAKMEEVFEDYLPWSNANEDAIEDCRSIWWLEVVEQGWEPDVVEDGLGNIDSDEIGLIGDLIIEEVANELGIPYDEVIVL